MTPSLLYLGRASLYLAIFYAFYLLVMRRTTLFRFNRIALLSGTVACHLLPALRLRTVFLAETAVPVSTGTLEALGEPVGTSAPPFPWLTALYLAGVAAVLLLCLLSVLRTRRIIRSGTPQPCEGCRLTLVDRDVPSFSWGRRVVMSRTDYEHYPAILSHELQHIRCHHSLDVLLMSAVTALHWFNPLVWIARAELRLLHEYEADEGLLNQGIDATQYQLLLVRKAVGEQRFSLANGFNHAKLKQRIAMMQHKNTSGWMRLAYVALLPFLAGTMFLCNPARAEIRSDASDATVAAPDTTGKTVVPFSLVEKKPTFQGNDAVTFSKWVAERLLYPEGAKKERLQGRVLVQFTVCDDGVVRDAKVLRGVNPMLDAEALRVISASPKWEPGLQDGKPVNVTYMFPVFFQLQNNKTTLGPATNAVDPESGRQVQAYLKVSMENDPHDSIPFAQVEQKPTFQGNDAATFAKWVAERLTYPKEAKDQKIQGRVMVAFDVCEDGVVRNVKVLRGVNPALDTEALRVINSSPKWEPGFQDGKPVKVTYQFPVVFQMSKNERPGFLFIPVLRRPGFYRIIRR
ncbi:MAG: M56 family metallopeptidase [Bacteroidales bacterium]|nr:M56 family metallopeptidase [Bacteroidales bacterium]